ncbi:MAG: ribonuclease Z [Candidatus Pacearchaeota archaeon]
MADKIKVVFLGSGSAVPTAERNHPAVLLKYKNENILFDCGEGTQRQFRKAKISICKLTKLFITHWHGDHVLGIPGLLQTLAFNDYNRKLQIYGPKGTKKYLDEIFKIFMPVKKIYFEVRELDGGTAFETIDFKILSHTVRHNTPCLAYSFIEKGNLRIDKKKLDKLNIGNSPLIKKLKEEKDVVIKGKKLKFKDLTYRQMEKKIVIMSDTKYFNGIEKIPEDADLLVIESTYLDEEELANDNYHLTVLQSANIAKKAKVKKLILTHLSQKHQKNKDEFIKIAKKHFKNSDVAEDLMSVEV